MSTGAETALYVHWPFCQSNCPYCDFNSHVRDRIDEDAWRQALLRELAWEADRVGRRPVRSIFFGGGTPSLMAPETVGAVIDTAARLFDLAPDAEITLEANPGSVEAGRFAGYRAAGVNRVSLGVQALDDQALRFLGRRHDAGEARAAIALANRHFARTSFDLIYARPGQDKAAWAAELEEALTLAGEHLSLYQLTIEPGTAFATAHARGDFHLPDEDTATALFDLTQERLAAAGLPAYEISNHARPGAESRHNMVYWTGLDYLGIGPGAHGRVTLDGATRATRRHRAPEIWLQRVTEHGHALVEETALSPEDRVTEIAMMGLRLTDGLAEATLRDATGLGFTEALDPDRLAALVEEGDLARGNDRLRATAQGRRRLNAVLGYLLGG